MQKYIHLVQIMETEKVAANQLRTQLEDQDTEIERLKAEVCMNAPTSACACIRKTPNPQPAPVAEGRSDGAHGGRDRTQMHLAEGGDSGVCVCECASVHARMCVQLVQSKTPETRWLIMQ